MMSKLTFTLLSIAALSGCYVPNRVYNKVPNSVVQVSRTTVQVKGKEQVKTDIVDLNCTPSAHACLAFLEFDEMGEAWDPGPILQPGSHQSVPQQASGSLCPPADPAGKTPPPGQLCAALQLIQKARSMSGHPVILTFIHGWKNNADRNPRDPNGNVVGFEGVLEYLAEATENGKRIFGDSPVVGIYVSWRGDLISKNFPASRNLSYFNRERAAIRIPGASMTAALTEIMLETHRGSPDALAIMVGHSFGGLVLERTLTQAMTDFVLRQRAGRDREGAAWADLVVYLNSAAAASEGKQMMDLLKDLDFGVSAQTASQDSLRRSRERPLVLSISSLGDTATRFALPFGHGPSFLNQQLSGGWRTYDAPKPKELPHQSSYYLSTTAHLEPIQSHIILENPATPGCPASKPYSPAFQLKNGKTYQICEKPGRWNDTPYWAMQMPASIVPDHTGIFNENFIGLLRQFLPSAEEMSQVKPRPRLMPKSKLGADAK
jgi:hypothetical protein